MIWHFIHDVVYTMFFLDCGIYSVLRLVWSMSYWEYGQIEADRGTSLERRATRDLISDFPECKQVVQRCSSVRWMQLQVSPPIRDREKRIISRTRLVNFRRVVFQLHFSWTNRGGHTCEKARYTVYQLFSLKTFWWPTEEHLSSAQRNLILRPVRRCSEPCHPFAYRGHRSTTGRCHYWRQSRTYAIARRNLKGRAAAASRRAFSLPACGMRAAY
jgi:hypothetical protein